MNKKGAVWAALAAAVIVCAFLLPGILLRVEQNGLEGKSETFPASDLNGEPLSLTEKLNMLLQDSSFFAQEESLTGDSFYQIQEQFMNEMFQLEGEYEAVPYPLCDIFSSGLTIDRYLLIDPDNRSFSYYSFYAGNAVALMDAESGKILQISVYDDGSSWMEIISNELRLGERETDGDSPLRRMAYGWARYYGLTVSDVSIIDYDDAGKSEAIGEPEMEGKVFLTRAVLSDGTDRVGFAVSCLSDGSGIVWHSVSADIAGPGALNDEAESARNEDG